MAQFRDDRVVQTEPACTVDAREAMTRSIWGRMGRLELNGKWRERVRREQEHMDISADSNF